MRNFIYGLGVSAALFAAPMASADQFKPPTVDSFGSEWAKQIKLAYDERGYGMAPDPDVLSVPMILKIRNGYAQHMGVPQKPMLRFMQAEIER